MSNRWSVFLQWLCDGYCLCLTGDYTTLYLQFKILFTKVIWKNRIDVLLYFLIFNYVLFKLFSNFLDISFIMFSSAMVTYLKISPKKYPYLEQDEKFLNIKKL